MSSEKTKNYYNGIAKGYKELYHEEQIRKINLIDPHLQSESISILDLGSGDGVLNDFLINSIKLTSFDLSEELLKLNPNPNKVQGDVKNLPFKDNQFDLIISLTMIQDVEEIDKAIEEIKRVCKDKLILSFLKNSKKRDLIIEEAKKYFNIKEEIEEEKDLILICKK